MSLAKFKNIIQTSLLVINSIIFVIIIFYLKLSANKASFASTSTFFLNTYILILLILILIHTIFPIILFSFLEDNLGCLSTKIGKGICICAIALIYIGSDNMPQMSMSIIFFISGIVIISLEKICNCDSNELRAKDEGTLHQVNTSSSIDEAKAKEAAEKNKDNPYNIPEDF